MLSVSLIYKDADDNAKLCKPEQQKHRPHLLEPRSSRELAWDMPVDGENMVGEEKPDMGCAVEGEKVGVRSRAQEMGISKRWLTPGPHIRN